MLNILKYPFQFMIKIMLWFIAFGIEYENSIEEIKKPSFIISENEEINAKFNVVFKGCEDRVNEIIKELKKNYVLSKMQIKDGLSTIQDYYLSERLSKRQAVEHTYRLFKLVIEMSNYKHKPTEDIIDEIIRND